MQKYIKKECHRQPFQGKRIKILILLTVFEGKDYSFHYVPFGMTINNLISHSKELQQIFQPQYLIKKINKVLRFVFLR
jgi:predicted thioesterase